jgi:tetratricopeptide (TPR) repeat protein
MVPARWTIMRKNSNTHFAPMPAGLELPRSEAVASSLAEALKLHQAGRLADAERIYRRVLATRPDNFDSLHLLGVIFYQRGHYAEAVRQIDAALQRNPNNAAASNNRGNALMGLKRFEEALASYERAIAVQRDFADAHSNRGNALSQLERFEEALASYDRALRLRRDFAEAHSNRGDVLHKLNRFDDALASCDRALALCPGYAEAHCNRGNALHALGRLDEALASHNRALALRPDYAEAHSGRGNALRELKRFLQALASYDRALVLRRDFAEAHCNRGSVLSDLKRYDEALASYDCALILRQNLAQVHSNRGNALKELDRFDEALASYDRALVIRPDFADAHFNEALCRLLLGDFARGWDKNEWRWGTAQLANAKRVFAQPLWLGSDEIAGKTVLLHAEQGLGDTIQFCRYLPLVMARGAQVVLEVQSPLCALMSALPGAPRIVAGGDPLPDFDLHCPLLSLPLAFSTRLETIPSQVPYLAAPHSKTGAWRDRLGDRRRPRVGLVWAGNPRKELPNANRIDAERSMAFARLAPLFQVAACEFYSLQKGDDAVRQLRESDLRQAVIDWTDELHDFSDTAALIENLDLVISVDTSVAHLAGALGKPFWLLNRYNTCWRWLRERDDSPWYPTARLFRQDAARDWDHVIARVRAALDDYVSACSIANQAPTGLRSHDAQCQS